MFWRPQGICMKLKDNTRSLPLSFIMFYGGFIQATSFCRKSRDWSGESQCRGSCEALKPERVTKYSKHFGGRYFVSENLLVFKQSVSHCWNSGNYLENLLIWKYFRKLDTSRPEVKGPSSGCGLKVKDWVSRPGRGERAREERRRWRPCSICPQELSRCPAGLQLNFFLACLIPIRYILCFLFDIN